MNDAKRIVDIYTAQQFTNNLFDNNNYSTDYIYGYLARNAGYMCKKIWQEKSEPIDFIRTISWIFALSNKLELNLEDCFLSRYPNRCPYCISEPCICIKTNKRTSSYLPAYKAKEELEAQYNVIRNTGQAVKFQDMASMIDSLYPNNEIIWRFAGPWRHIVKIQEEVSEIHEAMSGFLKGNKPVESVGEEIADTFAWTLAAWKIVHTELILDEEFIDYYYKGCPVCLKNPCECDERSDRSSQLVDKQLFSQLENKLDELEEALSVKDQDIDEIKKSLAVAKETQSEPVARKAVEETKTKMKSIEEGIDATDRNAKKIVSIVKSIISISKMFPFV